LTQRGSDLREGVSVPVDQGEVAAARREHMHERGADTLAGAGHDRHPIAEREGHCRHPSV
jgi:hypothetical protein